MRPWRLELLGAHAVAWTKAALDRGWSVVVTADLPTGVAEALRLFPQGLDLVRIVYAQRDVQLAEAARQMGQPEADVQQLVGMVAGFLDRARVAGTVLLDAGRLAWVTRATAATWLDRVADETDRTILAYLERHGAIIERDLVELVGNARRLRRFAGRVEELSALAPFRIVTDTLPDGSKRYAIVRD